MLVGYGDDSVAQLGGAHLACENISNVAAKLLEDARIGIAPLEKSTRYVRFDQKDAAGNYLFYREPKIMASRHRDAYLEVMNLLFDTYSRQMEPMLASIAKALPIEQVEVRDPTTRQSVGVRATPRKTSGCAAGRRPPIAPPCALMRATCCAVICRRRR